MLESGKRTATRCFLHFHFPHRMRESQEKRHSIRFRDDRFNEIWWSTGIFPPNACYNLAAKHFVHSFTRRLIIIARRLITFSFCLLLPPSVSSSPWKSIFVLLSSLLPLGFSAISSSRENISFEQRACRPDFYYKRRDTHARTYIHTWSMYRDTYNVQWTIFMISCMPRGQAWLCHFSRVRNVTCGPRAHRFARVNSIGRLTVGASSTPV